MVSEAEIGSWGAEDMRQGSGWRTGKVKAALGGPDSFTFAWRLTRGNN